MNATNSPVGVADDDSYRDLLAGGPLILLHFHVAWCGLCYGAVGPVLAEVAENHPVKIAKVNGRGRGGPLRLYVPLAVLIYPDRGQ